MKKRVVITGLGLVTCLGEGIERNWSKMISGNSGVKPISSFDASTFPVKISTEISGFDPKKHILNKKLLKLMNRHVTFGLAAAKLAVAESCLELSALPSHRVGVYMGSGETGGSAKDFFPALEVSLEKDRSISFHKFGSEGIWRINPLFLLRGLPNNLLCYITIEYNAQGPNNNFVMSPVASSQAIGEGFKVVQRGDADVMIVGGSDSLVGIDEILKYSEMKLLSEKNIYQEKAFQPFDRKRDGFVVGEGAGILILEELSHALRRKAPIYAEIVGYGCSSDGYHIIELSPEGKAISLAIESALQDSRIASGDIDYICAHGNATQMGDLAETRAMKDVFGKKAYDIPISSIKPMIGHLGAASGAVEFIGSILTSYNGIIPPTINYDTPDPVCDLDYVPNTARKAVIDVAMSINYGIGGQSTALIVKRLVK
jgi:3-oxoacyl-[acyl-carrier-protein] synthase II